MLTLATIILALSVLISLARLVLDPSPADKVITLDIVGFQLLGLTLLLALHDQRELPLLFAFVLSLLGFISTLILSRLIQKSP